MSKQLKIALPKGKLLSETASMLAGAGWGLDGYAEKGRNYRLKSSKFPELMVKMFHERDIPIQVAIGNYDLGICGLDWVEELLVKYSASPLVKLKNLGYGGGSLYMTASGTPDLESIQANNEIVRLVSEYPNLAEAFALKNRLRRFSVFTLWGAAEAYPPESAELALISGGQISNVNLSILSNVLNFDACLIANKNSWEREDLSGILASLEGKIREPSPVTAVFKLKPASRTYPVNKQDENIIRLALPDGHQQSPTCQLLTRAGIRVDDYPSDSGNRRPASSLEGVSIKVIRPQDMPGQVANGNFDLAITGKDWLTDHLYQFPSSPVTELLDLKYARVRIIAAVSKELPVENIPAMKQYYADRSKIIRVASEYTNIADKVARDSHMGVYKIIPTWGATEVFIPEDADMLIDNTETGSTLARQNLKIINTLFESAARLIGNKNSLASPEKGEKIKGIVEILKRALG